MRIERGAQTYSSEIADTSLFNEPLFLMTLAASGTELQFAGLSARPSSSLLHSLALCYCADPCLCCLLQAVGGQKGYHWKCQ